VVGVPSLLAVCLGGAIGSAARYALGGLVHRFAGSTFPAGTFVVNVVGCLVFGVIVTLGTERSLLSTSTRTFLLLGVLGGFTTFSSYAFETLALVRDGEWAAALGNALGQVLLGVAALWAGSAIARLI
jgi:CrcB protein